MVSWVADYEMKENAEVRTHRSEFFDMVRNTSLPTLFDRR